jgi:hypothetical protein
MWNTGKTVEPDSSERGFRSGGAGRTFGKNPLIQESMMPRFFVD